VRGEPGPAAVTLISKLGGMSVSSVLRFCRGSASRVLPVLTPAFGPKRWRSHRRAAVEAPDFYEPPDAERAADGGDFANQPELLRRQ
jgi:hypothetical protein